MPTVNKWAVSIGKAHEHEFPSAAAVELDLTSGRAVFEFNGDGSARNMRNVQSMFVDNSQNNSQLVIRFNGGLMTLRVPALSQAILPVAVPRETFLVEFTTAPSIKISVTFFDVCQPYIVWKV